MLSYCEHEHQVTDAFCQENKAAIVIQPDYNGLTITFPNGRYIVVDFCKNKFDVFLSDESGDVNGESIATVGLE